MDAGHGTRVGLVLEARMRQRLGSVLTVAVLVASACSSSTGTPSPRTAATLTQMPVTAVPSPTSAAILLTGSGYKATPPAATGGKIVLAGWQYPATFNPYFARLGADFEVTDSMFDGLLTVTPDLRYAPDLALDVPTVDNGGVVLKGGGMDVTFNLKPGMLWSDGQPITCDDVRATWAWNMDPANSSLAGGTAGWEDISGIDGGTGTRCVIHYSRVYEGYLGLVSAVLPAHYITTVPVKDAPTKLYPMINPSAGVYSGPYVPTAAKARAQVTLVPNPKWESISGHAPWLQSVTWKYYSDPATMIAAFNTGGYDVGQGLGNADIPALAGIDPSQTVIHDSLAYELLAFNNASIKDKFGTDYPIIIGAIKLATDRPAIAGGPLAGHVTLSNNFTLPLTWYYKDLGGSVAVDPTSASTLLANAGWSRNADGYLSKEAKLLELSYCSDNSQVRVNTLKLVAAQLKSIGIKVDVNTKPSADVFGLWNNSKPDTQCNLRRGNFDVAEFSYEWSPMDPLLQYRAYRSDEIPDNPPNTGENVTRVNLPALDKAYGTVKGSVDFRQIRDAMSVIQDIYGSDKNTYELPLYFRKDVWLVGSRLHNFTGNPSSAGGEWNIGDWWVG
jgi:peptide/nickel transport system substrate-binding protein